MRIRFGKMMVAVFLVLLTTMASAQKYTANPNITDPNIVVNSAMLAFMRAYQIPGAAVEMYVNGKPYSFYYGYANRYTQTPVTGNTIFALGSITKVFTSVLLAIEADAGVVHLWDPVTKYIPALEQYAPYTQQVTLENLATHTGSLPFNAPKRIQDENSLYSLLTRWRPARIGTQWGYSNFGVGVLGNALQHATNQSYQALVREKILVPLGMSPIGVAVPTNLQANLAQAYDGSNKEEVPTPLNAIQAAWAMKASGHDMMRFLTAAIGLPGTPPAILRAMHTTQVAYVAVPTKDELQGLGWEIQRFNFFNKFKLLRRTPIPLGPFAAVQLPPKEQILYSDALIDKTGSWDGFRAYIAVLPDHKSGIVIMVNKGVSTSDLMNIGRKILFKTTEIT